jgi:hypothetical protein
VDAADVAYRRRFLLDKYPQLADGDTLGAVLQEDESDAAEDVQISVLGELADAGGPDLIEPSQHES